MKMLPVLKKSTIFLAIIPSCFAFSDVPSSSNPSDIARGEAARGMEGNRGIEGHGEYHHPENYNERYNQERESFQAGYNRGENNSAGSGGQVYVLPEGQQGNQGPVNQPQGSQGNQGYQGP